MASSYTSLPKIKDLLAGDEGDLGGQKWAKEQLLGKGCFGKVFLGRLPNGQQIAAKQVSLTVESPDEAKKIARRVAKEMAILESVSGVHRNVVRYYGWSLSRRSKSIYLLMQYVEGPTLDSHVKGLDRSMTEDEIRVITKQLLSALVFVHSKGVVHKDVKPDNIIIRESDGVVKLIDFGIAGICGHHRENIGPPLFSAPEIMNPELQQSTKCDSFSLGITVYFMATKSHPLQDEAPSFLALLMPQLLVLKMASMEPLPEMDSSKFSRGLCEFYRQSTVKHPDSRASCSELLLLSEFITGKASASRMPFVLLLICLLAFVFV